MQHQQFGETAGQLVSLRRGAVTAGVIDHDHMKGAVQPAQHVQPAGDRFRELGSVVACQQQHRQAERRGDGRLVRGRLVHGLFNNLQSSHNAGLARNPMDLQNLYPQASACAMRAE